MIGFTLKRLNSDALTTAGELIDSAGAHLCATLELAYHAPKLAGRTRIPAGTYKLAFRGWSHFDKVYEERVERDGQAYRGMIEICDVPGFAAVLFHCGNSRMDTKACILTGEQVRQQGDEHVIPGGMSLPAFLRAYRAMAAAIENGGAQLVVQDLDRNGAA